MHTGDEECRRSQRQSEGLLEQPHHEFRDKEIDDSIRAKRSGRAKFFAGEHQKYGCRPNCPRRRSKWFDRRLFPAPLPA